MKLTASRRIGKPIQPLSNKGRLPVPSPLLSLAHRLLLSLLVTTGTLVSGVSFSQQTPNEPVRGQLKPLQVSGIYPSLAMFNAENECGTGAVVPWANRLWVVTYAPHQPKGSTDKLYEITEDLKQIVRPESIGGTPANRMIHPESKQLFIGPYVIRDSGEVRTIPYSRMFGRPTGNARHLFDPARKIYYATMEEGIYEVDVETLEVKELWADEQKSEGRHSQLPGYHGKGLYSTPSRLIYANNGEHGAEALKNPATPSGVLAEWDGKSDQWKVVQRNQFTEVTGPSGIYGSSRPDDPVWSIGWDHRSLILMTLFDGEWHRYRLPKASHSYDGAHGWNTEWPRIREIGESDLLMTMHGMFWRFPKGFQPKATRGILPRSSYLKVVGDFCRWKDSIVLGCDDTAKSEFLNKRKAKGSIAAPQSQSNLWFVAPNQLDQLGPVYGRGALWLQEDVESNQPSDPMLVDGFQRRGVHLRHASQAQVSIRLEGDLQGNGQWTQLQTWELAPHTGYWFTLPATPMAWVRLRASNDLKDVTAWFELSNEDRRSEEAGAEFDAIAKVDSTEWTGGIVRSLGADRRALQYVANRYTNDGVQSIGLYELDADLKLRSVDDSAALAFNKTQAAIPVGILQADEASVLFIDDAMRRWRLPRGSRGFDRPTALKESRVCREVATERDLFNAYGTFFELPAENAGGFSKVRAVATHNRAIVDYCSYRGLLVLSGLVPTPIPNPHVITSEDRKTALWVGAIDDVWRLGKPRGEGGPWLRHAVQANEPSDPYLMSGYDQKSLTLQHEASDPVEFLVECDITGSGLWQTFRKVLVRANEKQELAFPDGYSAYWLRVTTSKACVATAQANYR